MKDCTTVVAAEMGRGPFRGELGATPHSSWFLVGYWEEGQERSLGWRPGHSWMGKWLPSPSQSWKRTKPAFAD